MEYGVPVERGRVIALTDGGAKVESFTRPGIVSAPIGALNGYAPQVDDWVYFFLFEDGSGAILGPFHIDG